MPAGSASFTPDNPEHQPPVWRWIEGSIDADADHIALSYKDDPKPLALVAPGPSQTFIVEFLREAFDEGTRRQRDCERRELNFYLVELGKPDPWAYAIYHCGTAANAYSDVHWGFFPRGHEPRFKRSKS